MNRKSAAAIGLALAAVATTAAKPQMCPGGWLRNDGWTKDRTDSVHISVEGDTIEFTPSPHITITKVCVNGQKRIVRFGESGISVTFQLSPLTGFTPYDAAVQFK